MERGNFSKTVPHVQYHHQRRITHLTSIIKTSKLPFYNFTTEKHHGSHSHHHIKDQFEVLVEKPPQKVVFKEEFQLELGESLPEVEVVYEEVIRDMVIISAKVGKRTKSSSCSITSTIYGKSCSQ